jgi:hypothetical protein
MALMKEDTDLENILADIEDVVNDRIVDMDHAKYVYKLIDAVCDLEDTLEWIHHNERELHQAINKRSIKELDEMIGAIKQMNSKIESYFDEK